MIKKVPFNDTSRIYNEFSEHINEALINVASSGWWLLGQETKRFANSFNNYLKSEYCVPVGNGTDALELAIKALSNNLSKKNEIITVANAGGYTSIACHLCGVTPVYADIEERTLLVDINSIKENLTKNTLAVVVTHLFGAVVDVLAIRKMLDESGYESVVIIEDCAQAHGAELNGCKVGTLGDIGTFSFYPTKNLGALGDGGAVVTNDQELYESILSLHQYGWSEKYKISNFGGKNTRMDELQAAVLNILLPHLDNLNRKRVNIYNCYKALKLKSIKFNDYNDVDYVAHLAVIKTEKREELKEFLFERGISSDIHYPVTDNLQKAWFNSSDVTSKVPVSERLAGQILSIPCFPTMTEAEVQYVCQALLDWDSLNGNT